MLHPPTKSANARPARLQVQTRTIVFLVAIVACTSVGCGDRNRNRLLGQWGITAPEALMDRIDQADQMPAATEVSQRMVLTFKPNGILSTRTRMGDVDQEKVGTWQMTSFDEAFASMSISCEINAQTSEHEIIFVDENNIELVPPNMAGLTMRLKFSKLNGQ